MQRFGDEKPHIDYPCAWSYRIIGTDEAILRALIKGLVDGAEHHVALSHTSRSGRYVTLILTLEVRDEEHRLGLYRELSAETTVKYVL